MTLSTHKTFIRRQIAMHVTGVTMTKLAMMLIIKSIIFILSANMMAPVRAPSILMLVMLRMIQLILKALNRAY